VSAEAPKETEGPGETPARGPVRTRLERREQAALDALRTLLRDLYIQQYGVTPPVRGETGIELRLKVDPANAWALRFDPSAAEQFARQMADAQAEWDVFQRGAAYCFRCDSSACEHARPPTPLSVFKGYGTTGAAEWHDFAQSLLEAQDERVDQLFQPAPSILARVQFGRELKQQQLSSFGRASKTYALLGQVTAGYYSISGREIPQAALAPTRLAITFQAVETRGAGGRLCLHLNSLAALPAGLELADLLAAGWEPPVARARDVAARELEQLEWRAQAAHANGRNEEERGALRGVPNMLRRLAESLERGFRQETRRTRHAEQRRRDQRPVHKALDDTLAVAPSAVFFDEKTGAFVACGAQGRAHVFSAEQGRHVTSFTLKPDGIEFRLRTRRWRAVTAEEFAVFRELIARLVPPRE